MKIISGNHYRVAFIPEDLIREMGITLEYYPAGQVVKVTDIDLANDCYADGGWCTILCPNRMVWDIRMKYLTNRCIWEAT